MENKTSDVKYKNFNDFDPNSIKKDSDNVVINIKHLFKSYGKKEVLHDINLEVKKGEVFGYIGKNGIGKSTTIDCIVGLKEATSGEVTICGKNILTDSINAKMCFGYVPSEPTTYENMTGNEFLQFIGTSYGMIEATFYKNYKYLVSKFQMSENDMDRPIKTYSHGMKQKVCLMASLIHNPKVWILDEPTVGLDIIVYEVLVKMIKEFAQNGRTVFVTSHNIDLVSKICDRVAIINGGKIAELIDFNEEPLKRRQLEKIFLKVYGGDIN